MEKYIRLNNDDLLKLHNDLLTLLIEFDRLCSQNNIKYYLTYGTLLGSIRHKGFIPWDDDVDVYMMREDYDKFCDICSKYMSKKFILQTKDTDKYYNWSYGKIRLVNTDFIRSGQEHLKQKTGIFMDIIPIDNTIDNKFIQDISAFICKYLRKILWSQIGMVTEKNIIKRYLYAILNRIPKKLTVNIFNIISKQFNNLNTDYLVSYHFLYGGRNKMVLRKEWFSKCIKVDFEGYKFSAPIGYDKILETIYGNYMELPPKNEQIGH